MSTHEKTADVDIERQLRACESLMVEHACQPGADRLNELIHYHFESGGSRIRARLALSAGQALQLTPKTCIGLAASAELIHNASLLHDDIQDKSTHRRGRQAAWHRFDHNTAMCAGTLLLSAAFDIAVRTTETEHTNELVARLHQSTADLIVGQTLDLRHTQLKLGIKQYLRMAAGKSGALLALPLELVLIAARQPAALAIAKSAGESFAIAYQVADDIADFEEDLAQGNCNIVEIMQSQGTNQTESVTRAVTMAQNHLALAIGFAEQLPNFSGQLLIKLCKTLPLPAGVELLADGG